MSADDPRIAAMERHLAELTARVAALEAPPRAVATAAVATTPAPPLPAHGALLEVLRQRDGPPYARDGLRGALLYAGAVDLAGAEYVWHIERALPFLLDLDAEAVAPVLLALGNPWRLRLVRALLGGPRGSQQLQEAVGLGSPGQLYHHLKELLAAGVIEQRARSEYRLAARKIVPFLIILAAALDLGGQGADAAAAARETPDAAGAAYSNQQGR